MPYTPDSNKTPRLGSLKKSSVVACDAQAINVAVHILKK